MKYIFFSVLLMLLLGSCQKEIVLNLEDSSGTLVIEGNISNEAGSHYVRVSKSTQFTEKVNSIPVADALVIIQDNSGQQDTLQYESDGNYRTTHFATSPGNIYMLFVTVEEKTYSATSKMPEIVSFDSIRVENSPFFGGENIYSVIPVFSDPELQQNFYSFKTYINGKQFGSLSLFNDELTNGQVNQSGIMLTNFGEDGGDSVKAGDEVTLEMKCIDEAVYTYYFVLGQLSGGSLSGMTPNNPPGNFNNGALGVFSAYTVQKRSVILE